MGILSELSKRAAMKAAAMAREASPVIREIPTAVEQTRGALVPVKSSGLEGLNRAVAEGAIESPSRRKFLKQAAVSAARQAVPDAIAEPLMAAAGRLVVKESIPVAESIPSLLDHFIENGYLSFIPGDLRDLSAITGMSDEAYWTLRKANRGSNFVNDYDMPNLLEEHFPGLMDEQLSKIHLRDAEKYADDYDLMFDESNPLRSLDFDKYHVPLEE